MTRRPLLAAVMLVWLIFASRSQAQPEPQILPLNTPQLWQRAEFKVFNVPAATNPFDPETITVDAVFRSPSFSYIVIRTNGQPYATSAATTFTVPTNSIPRGSGYIGLATNDQYFQTSDGEPLRLVGENVGWPGGRGT